MEKVEKFWDRIASRYDAIESNDMAYRIFIEEARRYIKADDTVIDFGCGTGLICNEIAQNVRTIYAIDTSPGMLEISKSKASERQIQNIIFSCTSIFDEKFKEGSIDILIAFNIFHLLEEPLKYFQRINHLLKPGGYILSATPCMSEAPALNLVLKLSSMIGLTPKLNSFSSTELEQLFLKASLKTIKLNRIKPKSPQYFCISEKNQGIE